MTMLTPFNPLPWPGPPSAGRHRVFSAVCAHDFVQRLPDGPVRSEGLTDEGYQWHLPPRQILRLFTPRLTPAPRAAATLAANRNARTAITPE